MVTCYPQEYARTHHIIDKSFFTGNDYDAKKERDTLARKLRKEGYQVETKKYRFDTKDSFTIHAVKWVSSEKEIDESLNNADGVE